MRKILWGLLLLAACSPGSSSDRTQDYLDQREDLLNDYRPIVGLYSGQVAAYKPVTDPNSNGPYEVRQIPLELGIYTEDIPNGIDADGKQKLLPTLRIRYRQLDAVRADVMLQGRYISDRRELNAASEDGSTTLRSRLEGKTLVGEIIRSGGKLGNFSLPLKSKEVPSYGDPQADLYRRTELEYRRIAGLYVGDVTPPKEGGISDKFKVQIQLNFTSVATGSTTEPRLSATFKRLDSQGSADDFSRLLNVGYILNTDPATLVMSADGNTSNLPNAYFISISGILENNIYTADLYDRRGLIGTLRVKRK